MKIPIPPTNEELLAQCDVETYRSGGPGGQHLNTTDSAVRLRHRPSGVVITCQDQRSQHQNKAIALERLRERLEKMNRPRRPRVPTRVPNKAKRNRLESKKRRSDVKAQRSKPKQMD